MERKSRSFLKVDQILLDSNGAISPAGEIVDLTLQEIVIYSRLVNRYEFLRSERKTLYDNQRSLARACHVGRTTVTRAIKKFKKLGWIKTEDGRGALGKSLRYTYVKPVPELNLAQSQSQSEPVSMDDNYVCPFDDDFYDKAPQDTPARSSRNASSEVCFDQADDDINDADF